MFQKKVLFGLACFLVLLSIPQVVKAATITSATLDKDTYLAGQTGTISVMIYNDGNDKIRVTELSAAMNYYYADDGVYVQKFFTNDALPLEISVGQSKMFEIPISLPTNLAPGYVTPNVEAKSEIWVSQIERWISSERVSYDVKLYVESPYKQLYYSSQEELQSTQQQLQERESVNENLTNTTYMLTATTMVFAAAAGIALMILFTRRPRPLPKPQS